MDTSLQARQIWRVAWQACLALLLTTTFWMFAGCDTKPDTPSISRETVTSEVELSHSVRLTEYNFDRKVLNSTQPVLVDFWASWCTPCLEMAPAIEELAAEFEGRAVVGRVNVDAQPEIAQRFRIDGVPVVLFFYSGQLIDRLEGGSSKTELARRLTVLLGSQYISRPHSEKTSGQPLN